MKKFLPVLLSVGCLPVLWAVPFRPVNLPAVEHLDTEVTTNVSIAAWQLRAAKFSFSLSSLATPSNNVEAAFGTDTDGDGTLSARETALVVGWDCGAWFVQKGMDGRRVSEASATTNEVKTLAWNYRLTASPESPRLSATADGEAVFADLAVDAADWLHNRGWNLMRLTGRGLDASGETFTIGTPSDPTAVVFR